MEPQERLSPAQYWEWRSTIYEMDIAKEKLKSSHLELKILQKESENLAVRMQLFIRARVESSQKAFEASQAEYERFKTALEKDIGQSLSKKVIDEITFEIKDLPDETTKKQEK